MRIQLNKQFWHQFLFLLNINNHEISSYVFKVLHSKDEDICDVSITGLNLDQTAE